MLDKSSNFIISIKKTVLMKYSILINTCDKFEDCWNPFFQLFSKFWPDYSGNIYLNTEYKDYSYPGLDIIAVKGCERHNFPPHERATWSQCLLWALELINTDIVLYMQEDYFLKDTVKNEIVEDYVNLMADNEIIKCIHLTDQAVKSAQLSEYTNLDIVVCNQRYRVSCQAALWKKAELQLIIREYENAWEFEEFGSQRSSAYNHIYLTVNKEFVKLNIYEIIPYIFTGIIQGKWYEEVIPLFRKNKISVDFSVRGFNRNRFRKSLLNRAKYRICKIPKIIRNYINIYRIKNHE